MPDLKLRQHVALTTITAARRAFANSPVSRLRAVSWLYRRTVRLAFGAGDAPTGFRGLRLSVPADDHVLTAGLAGGFYESIELNLLELLAARSRTVVDVGANIGVYACVAAARLPETGRLVAFEPVPANQEYLRRNLAQNNLSGRVQVEPLAVGAQAGEAVIHLAPGSSNHSLASGGPAAGGPSIPVTVTTLDSYLPGAGLPGPVDLVKIDVEGYDGYVLRGAEAVLRADRPALLIEYVPANLANAGFDAEEFLDIVFGSYPHVYLIDEPSGRLVPCDRALAARYAGRVVNPNLVAVARPEHREIVEEYRSCTAGRIRSDTDSFARSGATR